MCKDYTDKASCLWACKRRLNRVACYRQKGMYSEDCDESVPLHELLKKVDRPQFCEGGRGLSYWNGVPGAKDVQKRLELTEEITALGPGEINREKVKRCKDKITELPNFKPPRRTEAGMQHEAEHLARRGKATESKKVLEKMEDQKSEWKKESEGREAFVGFAMKQRKDPSYKVKKSPDTKTKRRSSISSKLASLSVISTSQRPSGSEVMMATNQQFSPPVPEGFSTDVQRPQRSQREEEYEPEWERINREAAQRAGHATNALSSHKEDEALRSDAERALMNLMQHTRGQPWLANSVGQERDSAHDTQMHGGQHRVQTSGVRTLANTSSTQNSSHGSSSHGHDGSSTHSQGQINPTPQVPVSRTAAPLPNPQDSGEHQSQSSSTPAQGSTQGGSRSTHGINRGTSKEKKNSGSKGGGRK